MNEERGMRVNGGMHGVEMMRVKIQHLSSHGCDLIHLSS